MNSTVMQLYCTARTQTRLMRTAGADTQYADVAIPHGLFCLSNVNLMKLTLMLEWASARCF